jgi:hypothetical protein
MPKEIQLPERLDAEQAADVLRRYAQFEEPEMVESETLSALNDDVAELKSVFAGILAEQSPLSQDALAENSVASLTEPFRDDAGDIQPDTLAQTPETQTGGGEATDDGPDADATDGFDPETLTLSEKERLQHLKRKHTSFANRGIEGRVDALEQEMLEVAGADDFDTLEQEVF